MRGLQSLLAGVSGGGVHHDGAGREWVAAADVGGARERRDGACGKRGWHGGRTLRVQAKSGRGSRSARIWALTFAIALAGLCGWGYLHLITPLELLGGAGGLVYLLISQTNSEDGIAKLSLEVLNVVVNTVVFFFIIRFIQRRISRGRRLQE